VVDEGAETQPLTININAAAIGTILLALGFFIAGYLFEGLPNYFGTIESIKHMHSGFIGSR
jgi:hypothetical protein